MKDYVLKVTNLNLCLRAPSDVTVLQIILLKVSVIREQRDDENQNGKLI